MRTLLLALGTLAAVVGAVSGERYVVTTQDNVGLYEHQTRKLFERPVVKVDKNDQLAVVAENKRHTQVRTRNGSTGWIENRLIQSKSARSFVFEDAQVQGYLDNPQSVYLLDATDPESEMLRLDRSFKDNLSENIDKETVNRIVE